MSTYAQYGEEEIFKTFFNNRENGFVVDIGAADGVTGSNSRFLIETLKWGGILVEPVPIFFEKLNQLYSLNERVHLVNKCIFSSVQNSVNFFQYGGGEFHENQSSTIIPEFKDKVTQWYGEKYNTIQIGTVTLEKLFTEYNVHKNFNLLSVDCEGADIIALQSNNWAKFRPELICVEHSMPKDELDIYMSSINYTQHNCNEGNTFYISK